MQVDVAIVGGGFSGTALAVQLLRRAERDVSVALIDREERIGRGVAYGTTCREHLLNVPAGRMSALADEPGHFTDWLAKSSGLTETVHSFLPRYIYGDYLEHTLRTAILDSRYAKIRQVTDLVVALRSEGEGIQIEFASGQAMSAKRVVMATGNYPPPDPAEMQSAHPDRYISYPWAKDALEDIAVSDVVLIMGSGLTAVDQIFTLNNRGFSGIIHVLSSRGLLPSSHEVTPSWSIEWAKVDAGSIRSLMRGVRRQIACAAEAGIGWRAVIDALRHSSQGIWKALSIPEQRRFLRHTRTLWDVHRHRVSPDVHKVLHELIQNNRLFVTAGRCVSVKENGNCATVMLRLRGSQELQVIEVNKIINCTGPGTIKRMTGDPFIQSICNAGLGRPDPIGMGVDTTDAGELIGHNGHTYGRLLAIGPLRKGNLWETTAVPEIRMQALELADHLLHSREESSGCEASLSTLVESQNQNLKNQNVQMFEAFAPETLGP